MTRRGLTRVVAVLGALAVSCGGAQAGILDTILGGGIPIPGIGGIRVSSGQRQYSQQPQTPRMVSSHLYNEAIRLGENNQLQEARMKFEQAVQADPSFDLPWAALVGSCMVSGQLEEGIQVGNQFVTNFPHSSRRKETELILQKLNEQLAKKHEIWQRVGRDGADSYFALATEGKNFYGWNLEAMPLKVYIGDGHGVRGYRKNDDIILNNSFAEWTKATEGHITFTRVDNLADANIECIWIDDPKDFPQNRGLEAGEAVPMLDSDGYIVSSKLYLLTLERNEKASVDDLVMHTICLHEIGHTLGLLGHSDVAGDVMYFTANGQKVQDPHLTQRDVNTLAKLYATVLQKRGSTTTSMDGQGQGQLQEFRASAIAPSSQRQSMNPNLVSAPPPPEAGKPQPYQIGKTFASNEAAIAYFEKVTAASPDDVKLLDDLGTAYDNYGIELANTNEVRRAEEFFNLALSIHRNSPDRKKLRITVANLTQLLRFEKRDSDAAQLEQSCKQVVARSGN
ncbi:hypothetical protein BH10CYA1_BH10CYA1_05910 [soil metagenome]